MSQPISICKHAFCPTQNITIDFQVLEKLEEKIKSGCKPALTCTTACVKVAPFQYSMYFNPKIPQSYLKKHNIWIIIDIHQLSSTLLLQLYYNENYEEQKNFPIFLLD